MPRSSAEQSREGRKRARENGKCITCWSRKVRGGFVQCSVCRRRNRKTSQRRRREYKAEGICLHCGAEDVWGTRKVCEGCAKKMVAAQRRMEKRRREEGLCKRCRMPAIEGQVLCERHALQARIYRARHRKKKKDGIPTHRCIDCNARMTEDWKRCEECSLRNIDEAVKSKNLRRIANAPRDAFAPALHPK